MFIYIDDLHYKNVSSFFQIFYLKEKRNFGIKNGLALVFDQPSKL